MHEATWRGTWLSHGPAPRVAAPAYSAPARRRDRHRALFEPSAQDKPGQRRRVGERAHVGCARQDGQAGPRQAAGERGHDRRGGYLVEFGRDQHDRNANGGDAIGPVVAGDGLERGCPRPASATGDAARPRRRRRRYCQRRLPGRTPEPCLEKRERRPQMNGTGTHGAGPPSAALGAPMARGDTDGWGVRPRHDVHARRHCICRRPGSWPVCDRVVAGWHRAAISRSQ